jgi:tubulin epsilon
MYDESISSFFRNGTIYDESFEDLAIGSAITDLRARAIVVDMEESVINNKILNGELAGLFDSKMCITD